MTCLSYPDCILASVYVVAVVSDYVGHFPAGLSPVDYGSTLPFGARTKPQSEHPLNEHFRYLEKARRKQYGDVYSKHPKLHYKPKYYKYSKYDTLKHNEAGYEHAKYENSNYDSYKYEKPKYKGLKYLSHEYPRHKYASSDYRDHKEYAPKPVYEAPQYPQQHEHHLAPESPPFFEPPRPYFSREPHPPRHEAHNVPGGDYPVLPPPPTASRHPLPPPPPPPPGHQVYPPAPETYHYSEEHHVTETYPAPPVYPVYSEPPPPPRGHRAGKALDRFNFNPEPYIETIAIAYHENERNFNSRHRRPKLFAPEYVTPHYPSPLEHRAPRVLEYAPRVPAYGRHVPPHASEYVAPRTEEHVAPVGRGYGHLVGGHRTPERTVTLTPYRVQVGTLYGLAAAGSTLSESVVRSDGSAAAERAKKESEVKSDGGEKHGQKA